MDTLSAINQALQQIFLEDRGGRLVELLKRWGGGKVLLKNPAHESIREIPIEDFFAVIVNLQNAIFDLERKVLTHASMSTEEKSKILGYLTTIQGSLTTFNFLFGNREDYFIGAKASE